MFSTRITGKITPELYSPSANDNSKHSLKNQEDRVIGHVAGLLSGAVPALALASGLRSPLRTPSPAAPTSAAPVPQADLASMLAERLRMPGMSEPAFARIAAVLRRIPEREHETFVGICEAWRDRRTNGPCTPEDFVRGVEDLAGQWDRAQTITLANVRAIKP